MDSCWEDLLNLGQFPIHAHLSNAPDLEIDVKICVQNQFGDLKKLQFQLYPVSQESHLILYFYTKIQLIAIFQATVLACSSYFILILGQYTKTIQSFTTANID